MFRSISASAPAQAESCVRGVLILGGEVLEGLERDSEVRTCRQLESIEAATGHVEELIALNPAHSADLASELVTRAQELRLAIAAAFADTAEFDCDPAREQELVEQIGMGVFQAGFDSLKRQAGRR